MSDEKPNQPVWELESTHPELVEPLRNALKEVKDPELGYDVVQLGLIRDVHLGEEEARITMILTTPFCPYGPALMDETRRKVEEALGKPAYMTLGMEMWDFSMMEEGLGADWGLY